MPAVDWSVIESDLREHIGVLDPAGRSHTEDIPGAAIRLARASVVGRPQGWPVADHAAVRWVVWVLAKRLWAAQFDWDVVASELAAKLASAVTNLQAKPYTAKEVALDNLIHEAVENAPSEWDPSHEGGSGNPARATTWPYPGLETALRIAARHISEHLKWDHIWQQIEPVLRSVLGREFGLFGARADDVVQNVQGEVWIAWRPDKEVNFDEPGLALALKIGRRAAAAVVKGNQSGRQGIDDGVVAPPRLPEPNPAILTNWFRHEGLTDREQYAFIARYVYGVPTWIAGAILAPGNRTKKALHCVWDRRRARWIPSLKAYLGIPCGGPG